MMHIIRLMTTGLLCLSLGVLARAQTPDIDFTQVTRPVVEVSDAQLIDFLLFELIIEPIEKPTRLHVIDVTQNGFGPDDVIVVYPTAEAFMIPEFLPDSVQTVMSSWIPEVDFKMDAGNLAADALAALIQDDELGGNRAEKTILHDVVQAVGRSYHDLPVGMLFRRDSLGFTFQMWDYNPAAMQYTPKPAEQDSTVFAVFELLQDVGYLPGLTGDVGKPNAIPAGSRAISAGAALNGIAAVPDQRKRQLATRTILLGSFDLDRSGMIDSSREVDAIGCDVWSALDMSFPGFLDRFGFFGPENEYLGGIIFSISSAVRAPMARRGRSCLAGMDPAATGPTEIASKAGAERLPESVAAFHALDAATLIVERAGAEEAGSATWAAAVARVLLDRFDADRSGSVDRIQEVDAVPCDVWKAIAATGGDFAVQFRTNAGATQDTGFIGVHDRVRREASSSISQCENEPQPAAWLRIAPRGRREPQSAAPASRYAAAKALSGLATIDDEEGRILAAKTILQGSFDYDGSGHIDAADELDGMPCEVWLSLETVFPDFARRYGFVDEVSAAQTHYLGSLAFNISPRLRHSASRRISACVGGRTPPATEPLDMESATDVISLPVSLRHFIDTSNALRVVMSTAGLEAGSAGWAESVRKILLDLYDLDRSGQLDHRLELLEVPCVVWSTVEATAGGDLHVLGLGGTGAYYGDLVGIAETSRTEALRRLDICTGRKGDSSDG